MADAYRFTDQAGAHTISRDEILATSFLAWSAQMRQAGKGDQISKDACVEDWVIVHGAWPATTDEHHEGQL